MASKSNFIVRGGADFSAIKKEIQKTQNLFQTFQGKINGLMKLTGLAVGARALIDFGKEAIGVASDLTEVQNVVDVTFGKMSADVNEFAKNALNAYGLSELSAKKYASTMGAMLKSSGLAGKQMEEMSKNLTALSADMASFYNLDNDTAFQKIRAGISGETEPLKQLGINMNVANLEAYNLSQGIKKSWKEMTQAEQVLTRYNYLMHVSADSQGDFARNTGTWANQTKILKERWQEFMGLIGNALIEIGLPVVKALNAILEMVNKILRKIGELYTVITGKELVSEANAGIADSADDASDSEIDLSSGIDKAAKSAKKALAPFDELNILQSGLGSGDLSGLNVGSIGGVTSNIKETEGGIRGFRKEFDDFFFMLDDRNKRGFFKEPIKAPDIKFAKIPDPVYKPNWGLELPPIPSPIFKPVRVPPIEDEEFQTTKQRYLTPIPSPNFSPALAPQMVLNDYFASKKQYQTAVAPPLVSPAFARGMALEQFNQSKSEYQKSVIPPVIQQATIPAVEMEGFKTSLENAKFDYKTALDYMSIVITPPALLAISLAFEKLAGSASSNMAEMKNNIITDTEAWSTASQAVTGAWGSAMALIGYDTAKSFTDNLKEAFSVSDKNAVNFANSSSRALKDLGDSQANISAEAAKTMVNNYNSGFEGIWENFKNVMKAIGERVSGFFKADWTVPVVGTIAATAITAASIFKAAPGKFSLGGAFADGAVLKKPTMGLMGEYAGASTNPEIVTPESLLTEIFRKELGQISGNQGNTDLYLTVQIGDDAVTEKVINNINRQSRISGKSVITV